MVSQFISIGLIALLGAMLPGPDFAIVVKNSLFYSRKAGCYTALGICAAVSFHMTYCVFGLVLLIVHSVIIFNLIKIIGALYLGFLGVKFLLDFKEEKLFAVKGSSSRGCISNFSAFRQGFLCNLLNPKATIFFFSLFTLVIKPGTIFLWEVAYAIEIALISLVWFCSLTIILSHSFVKKSLERAEKYISFCLGLVLLLFAGIMFFS